MVGGLLWFVSGRHRRYSSPPGELPFRLPNRQEFSTAFHLGYLFTYSAAATDQFNDKMIVEKMFGQCSSVSALCTNSSLNFTKHFTTCRIHLYVSAKW
jgi:hypothetical protein